MAGGVVSVWVVWVTIIIRAPLLFPFLLVVLLATSATPFADLALVTAVAFVAMAYGALSGLVGTSVVRHWDIRRRLKPPHTRAEYQLSPSRAYLSLFRLPSCAPPVLLMVLVIRAEHGLIVLAVAVGALLLHRTLGRRLRQAWSHHGASAARQ
jgi:hypothetical protein